MWIRSLQALNLARQARKAAILATDLDGQGEQVILEGEPVADPLADAATIAFMTGKASIVDIAGRQLFLNVYLPPPRMVVIGAVHISQALARMAPVAGYDLTIIDPRTAFATPERFADVDLVPEWPEEALARRPLDPYTALVALTHDPKIDDFAILDGLRRKCFYVGALGSRKTHAKRIDRLTRSGLGEDEIARIAAPIGLDIGAASPAEIAVAILAQVVQAFRRREMTGSPT
ncbi:XdhC/CoxF family protein [Pseudorhizobium endolithicum]|uniref:XdhC/CoxF family protein n=1 Tax=Pseudorhizobium endolithicum TaxID=1191678 RepID=A0ABM8PRS5_9HYPH|nr:XdhC family protein [Pseudorhizobium endolithicum]CAD6414659.1 XdhC/CoxF family protein [Rhizobium sp. Q54]CAD7044991.1 XdhC/CoxF family protein [Pseudorhizobium endolithicum]